MQNTLPRSVQDNPVLGRWVSFETPGRVTISAGKVELGQGILTALAQIAADELGLGIDRIVPRPCDTDLSPNEGFTAGSQSVEVSGASVQLATAQAHAALLTAAAARLGADPRDLTSRDGEVLRQGKPTGLDLWSVAGDVDWHQQITGAAPLRPQDDDRIVGTDAARIDMADKLALGGFIHDMTMPGMIHARIVRQPFRLARLSRVDEDWLKRRHPGVSTLRRGDFLTLLAGDEYAVHAAQLQADSFVRWEQVADRWHPATTAEPAVTRIGTAEPATTGAVLRAGYSRAMIAHASIGPSCAIALRKGADLTVWTHSQGIFALRDQIARCVGLDAARVRVIHGHGAGCYGHNGADDAALDAAIVAMDRAGTPVRVQWSREDEMSRGPLGAAMSARIEAALDPAQGRIAAWTMQVTSAPHAQRPGTGGFANLTSAEALDSTCLPTNVVDLPPAAGAGAGRNAVAIYDFPQEVRVGIDTQSPVRTSSLRSLGAHLNVFAIESAMDELAALAGSDPLDFRLRHLTDDRCRKVLTEAARMSGWAPASAVGEGRAMGLGVARYKNKGAWLAAVARVTVDEEVRVDRLWLAVDVGRLINPRGAQSQIEGGAIQAASWTLREAVIEENGRVPAFDWSSYPILRFSDIPEIETRFIADPADPPLGAGEAAQGPVAAAIGNAVSRALGCRVRDLPLTRDRLVSAMMDA